MDSRGEELRFKGGAEREAELPLRYCWMLSK